MLLAGMVSESQIIGGLIVAAGIWFVPPILYVMVASSAATKEQKLPIVWPVLAWLFGIPLLTCLGLNSGVLVF
jgi:hypothetical protein